MEKRIFAKFYQNETGKEYVRDWLLELSKEDRKIIGEDIKTVELGPLDDLNLAIRRKKEVLES